MAESLEFCKIYTATGTKTTTETATDGTATTKTEEIKSSPITAENAKETYADPEAVSNAIKHVNAVLKEEVENVQKALRNVSVDADGNMLSVEDATMEPVINEAADCLSGGIENVNEQLIEEIYDPIVSEFNIKQREYNEIAESTAKSDCQNKGADASTIKTSFTDSEK